MRRPRPAAGTTSQSTDCSSSRSLMRYAILGHHPRHPVELLVGAHHTDVAARALLDGIQAGLEIDNFSREALITIAQWLVSLVEYGHPLTDLAQLVNASVAEPQTILQQRQQQQQSDSEPLEHRRQPS